MSIEQELIERSGSACELCGAANDLQPMEVEGGPNTNTDAYILSCKTCRDQIDSSDDLDVNHWRCLNDSCWSAVPAVQVVSYRMLNRLKAEGWAQELIDMMYMEDDTRQWAKAGVQSADETIAHLDSNGVVLQSGDTVVITQTLKVKGTSLTAKRGTSVRNISLVYDHPDQIEGRVEGQKIVILTKFVRKTK